MDVRVTESGKRQTTGACRGGGDYYRHLFNCAGFAVISTDCQGVVVNCNGAAEALFNTTREQLVSRHVSGIIPEGSSDELHIALQNAVSAQQTTAFEADLALPEGKSKRIAVVIAPVLDDEGKILGLAAWARDISNRQILEQKLMHAEKMASLGTLASGVAHHFNNIIGGVATFVDFALQGGNPEAGRRALQMTGEAASRVSQITESLLTFAEKDVRQFDLSDLTEVILTFSYLVEKPLAEKGIEFRLELNPAPVLEVPGSRMHQMLGNLLDNAECAMPEGGKVTVGLESSARELVVTFADTGCGIEPKDLPHIFEPFFTTQGTCSGGDRNSAGLGLSVVHGIVHELGGEIDVSSDVGKGSRFTIRFPIPERS